jgi:hypothetical protein
MTMRTATILFGMLLAASAPELAAQDAPPAGPREEPRLVFERESFSYPTGGRRDPFGAINRRDDVGPMFEDLKLSMIIIDEVPGRSLVVLTDSRNRRYRLRRGEVVGDATVVDISPTRVVFSVQNLGARRQEILELKRTKPEGA